ncbi:HTH domain protein [Hartmannibacter diazotrophicus]|uniref:HTH domain protein n=1 Tax=Hartmannibacter diazotrophicus TaxID=1482074 RepID=A0A2C9D081_9HYPH|nr:YafY family protein [Hartmannibacter diazotrophicus]SON53656.1 HTH domain protein [Hartmannibacter diazotrophicus]
MRRADRLFEIIQLLRRKPTVRARDLAEALEVSERTIYRDIRDLIVSGVPIEGEAGIGYVLRAGFDLPPLMFKETEIEALVLGARIVETWGDKELSEAASDAIAKIEAVIPEQLRGYMAQTALLAPSNYRMEPIEFDLGEMRRAVRNLLKVRFCYKDVLGHGSERTVRPLSLAYFGPVWVLAAWCELRDNFRTFRLDRMADFAVTEEHFRQERGKTLHDFLKRPETWTRGPLSPEGQQD